MQSIYRNLFYLIIFLLSFIKTKLNIYSKKEYNNNMCNFYSHLLEQYNNFLVGKFFVNVNKTSQKIYQVGMWIIR